MLSSLEQYLQAHSSIPSEELRWIEHQSYVRTNYPQMLSGPIQGELLKLLVELSGAKRILEIGSFTGYSCACMALGLPEDGTLDAFEINDELEDLMREGWERVGVSDKIKLHIGDAAQLLREHESESLPYDLIFVDANKRQYCEYYTLLLPLLRPGGLLIVDDVLWDGKVYAETIAQDAQTQGIYKFNDMLASDPRMESVMLPLRDGITLARKKY